MREMLKDYDNVSKYYVRRASRVPSELRTRGIKSTYFEDYRLVVIFRRFRTGTVISAGWQRSVEDRRSLSLLGFEMRSSC